PPVARPHLHSFPTRRSSDLLALHCWRGSEDSQSEVALGRPPDPGLGLRCERRIVPAPLKLRNDRIYGAIGRRGDRNGAVHPHGEDRKSTRLNSSHLVISYAV